jgi:hypothetical protein
MQRAAADDAAVEFGNPEFLHRLIQRDQVLFQQDLAGVDVDQGLDRRNIGGAGTANHQPRGIEIRLGDHTCEGIGYVSPGR